MKENISSPFQMSIRSQDSGVDDHLPSWPWLNRAPPALKVLSGNYRIPLGKIVPSPVFELSSVFLQRARGSSRRVEIVKVTYGCEVLVVCGTFFE